MLPPSNYVYYTWTDPLQPIELFVSCGSKSIKLDFTSPNGIFGEDGGHKIAYSIFVDGIQTGLLFSEAMPLPAESMILVFLFCLDRNKKKNRVKSLSHNINARLEELYRNHLVQCEINPDDKELHRKKYEIDGFREVLFHGETATLMHSALHIRLNRVQIDNQLDYTIFPFMLYPVISKGTGSDYTEKPFIELSVLESKTAQSNIMQFKYFKVLIQEFSVQIDQGLIVAILAFLQTDSNGTPLGINMNTDLEQIQKPLNAIIKAQIESPSSETEMFFDNIHLSPPLKIHVSFSIHGSKSSEELLAEYPLVGFLLQTLNVAEVQDVILRLGYYERNNDKFTTRKITKEVTAHYQNQFMKQLHVLVLGLNVLGNPLGVIRGLAEGVESFFYEPYKGAVQGPMEFAEGVATGVRVLFGSIVGAFSKITSVVGKGLENLTLDEDYKASHIRHKEPGVTAPTHIAMGGKNVVMGFVDGVKEVVSKPIRGAKHGGASGFFKEEGVIGLVARPTGGMVDFASTSLDLIKR
ncbi:unnamed protein product [Rotaria magnacalcarata]|uniref:Vacuolar protein sorting-associated protein 13 DH-like domain-containing protein n=2 Tax=Rotaria magnacalcarata TaxID=392030 RepID=A0A817B1G5_9BILA|nr:unnamed protein product [Rotaria magnacalcarata]CAF4104898.1 unnamed protein product [Rotaria magnacalcarata]